MQKICIVIPCYNEENRFPKEEFLKFFNEAEHISFCLVNDGSKDNTLAMLKGIKTKHEERIYVHDLTTNSGKAEAVRQGMLEALAWKPFDFIGYFDADFATPLYEINHLHEYITKKSEYKIALGSRIRRLGAKIERTAKRHYLGRVFSTFASIILKLPVYDTQCGAKLFSSEVVAELFQTRFLSKWLFDIEIFARYRNSTGIENAEKTIIEVPLDYWFEISGSKLSLIHMLKVPFELFKIKRKYKIRL